MKVSKLNNKGLILSLIIQLEKEGYHIINEKYGNSYFIFEDEEDSVCHFEIKEIPGFLFGIWNICRFDTLEYQREHNIPLWSDTLDIDSKSELVFFTQYKRDLDKFKPSRSGFVTGLYRQAWIESDKDGKDINIEEWQLHELLPILKYMKKHHFKAIEYCGNQARYIWDDDLSSFYIMKEYIKGWYYHYKYKVKKYINFKWNIHLCKKYLKKLTQHNYIVIDQGDWVSPRIDASIRRKDKIDLKLLEKDNVILDKFYDRCWHNVSIMYRQYEINDKTTEDILIKDSKQRDWFFWYCNRKLNEDETILIKNVESVSDIDAIIKRMERKFEEDERSSSN